MKARLLATFGLAIGCGLFLMWVLVGQEAEATVQAFSPAASIDYPVHRLSNLGPASLSHTAAFTFTPAFTAYLPIVSKVAGPPWSPPILNDISNPDGDGNYTVSWSTVSGATSYTLEEDDNAAFSSPTTVYSGSGTSKSIVGKGMGTYYYRVKAANTFGTSDWSAVKSVVVYVPPPPCPQTGAWSGTTNHGDSITFTVSTMPSCQVGSLRITMFLWCTSWPGYRYTTIYYLFAMPISDNHFSYDFSPLEDYEGDFTSRTTVTGTWLYSESGTPRCYNSGTWAASYSP